MIKGKPLIEWVYRRAHQALQRVVVATDDRRILNVVRGFGGECLMTPRSCRSGTDRVAVVARRLKAPYYVNVQGDEPLISTRSIQSAVKLAREMKSIATVATKVSSRDQEDPHVVKVVLDRRSRSLYFSRSVIPFQAHGTKQTTAILHHMGLYVYPRAALFQFVRWPPAPLEKTEKLEQLRYLYNGMPIYVSLTRSGSVGVDTKADARKIAQFLDAPKKRMEQND